MPSLRNHAFVLLLQLIRRKRIYASARHLEASIREVRRKGSAPPHKGMGLHLNVISHLYEGRLVHTISPRHGEPKGHVLYLHGGAYVRPITGFHWNLIDNLVMSTGLTFTVPEYPLAPESTCEHTLGFVLRLYEELTRHHPLAHLTLMGDSAGGGLALATTLARRDRGQTLPHRLVLITPWVDVDSQHPQLHEVARRDPMLAIDGARHAGRLYAGPLGTRHPWVSPLHADLHDLPPTTMLAGTRDLCHLDTLTLVHRAREQGSAIDLRLVPDMIHVWPLLPTPEGKQARRELAELLNQPCSGSTVTPVHSPTRR